MHNVTNLQIFSLLLISAPRSISLYHVNCMIYWLFSPATLLLQGTQANMVPYLQSCLYHVDVQLVFAGGLLGRIHRGESQTAEPTGAGCLPRIRSHRSWAGMYAVGIPTKILYVWVFLISLNRSAWTSSWSAFGTLSCGKPRFRPFIKYCTSETNNDEGNV